MSVTLTVCSGAVGATAWAVVVSGTENSKLKFDVCSLTAISLGTHYTSRQVVRGSKDDINKVSRTEGVSVMDFS